MWSIGIYQLQQILKWVIYAYVRYDPENLVMKYKLLLG